MGIERVLQNRAAAPETPEVPPQASKASAPLTRLDNKSLEEFLAAHPPQNLAETQPVSAVEEKPKDLLWLRPAGWIVGAVVVFLLVVLAVRRRAAVSAEKEVRQKEEAVRENLQLSEEERKALETSETKPKTALDEKNYWRHVPKVFIYPFRGQVIFAAIAGTVFFFIMGIAMLAPFYGFVVSLMFFCYLTACMVSIIETAVTVEREDVFDWPDFTFWIDWLGKAVLLILAWVICYGPAAAYVTHFKRLDAVFLILIVLGSFISPMYTLAIALVGGVSSLNIINILKSIGAAFGAYALTVLLLLVTQVLNLLVSRSPLTQIPIWGGVFQWFLFVYFLFVNMRLLGIFYKAHRLKLRWYGEDE